MKSNLKNPGLSLTFSIKVSMLLIITACRIIGSDGDSVDGDYSINCVSDIVCTNAVSDDWVYLGLGEEAVQTIAINPCNSAHILAGTAQSFSSDIQGKIFRSIDCGESWEQVWEGGSVSQVVFDHQDPDIVYASPHGMIRSMDGGESWSIIDEGLAPHMSFTQRVLGVAVDPRDTRRVYASIGGFGAGWLFYTDDRGNSWEPIPGKGDFDRDIDDNRYLNGDLPGPILIDPTNPDVLYISPLDIRLLLKSEDRGMSWNLLLKEDNAEIYPIVFSPDYSSIYAIVRSHGGLAEGGLFEYNLQDGETQLHPLPYDTDFAPQSMIISEKTNDLIIVVGLGIYYRENNEWYNYTGESITGWLLTLETRGNLLYTGARRTDSALNDGGIYVRLL